MPWFKVDDGLHSHPKWLALSSKPRARALWVTAGSWCAANLTDGHVPAHVLGAVGGRKGDAQALVDAGLWVVTDGGWRFHGWGDFQPSAARVLADRRATAERVRKWREARRDEGGNGECNAVTPDASDNGQIGPTREVHAEQKGRDDEVHTPKRPPEIGISAGQSDAGPKCNAVSNAPPGPARPVPYQTNPLLTLAGRLTGVDARDLAASLPAEIVSEWQQIAGPGVDLVAEARAYLARHGDTTPRDPRGAWLGWLRRARPATSPPSARPACPQAGCAGGWLPDDPATGRAVPCPTCRPHLRPVPTTPEAS